MRSINPVEILIADDEEAMRSLMREALVKVGYAVVEADSGEDALVKFLDRRADAALLAAHLAGTRWRVLAVTSSSFCWRM